MSVPGQRLTGLDLFHLVADNLQRLRVADCFATDEAPCDSRRTVEIFLRLDLLERYPTVRVPHQALGAGSIGARTIRPDVGLTEQQGNDFAVCVHGTHP